MSTPAASEIYAQCLLHLKEGYPLYNPSPSRRLDEDELYKAHVREGVSIGDIGIIKAGGKFDFLLNICKRRSPHASQLEHDQMSTSNTITSGNVAELLRRIELNEFPSSNRTVNTVTSDTLPGGIDLIEAGDIEYDPNYISSRSPYRAYAREEQESINIGATFSPIPAITSEIGWEFQCCSRDAAVMVAPSGATLFEACEEQRFLRAITNIDLWVKYAEDRNRSFDSLTLVTGVVKCNKWHIAAISNGSRAHGGNISLSLLSPSIGGTLSWSHSWNEHVPKMYHSGPEPPLETSNQCLFIRGFRIMKRSIVSRFFGRVKATNLAENSPKYYKLGKLSNSEGFPASEASQSSPPQQLHSEGPAGGGDSADVDSDDDSSIRAIHSGDGYVLRKIPTIEEPYHPSDVINRYLLEQVSEADFAVTHDKDWWRVMKEEESMLPGENELLNRICEKYQCVLKSGVALLEENETRRQATRHPTPYSFVQMESTEPTPDEVGSIRLLGASSTRSIITEQRPDIAPSTSPKISMDDAHIPLSPDYCQFELTVVGATGLCGTGVWSSSQGVYVTIAVRETTVSVRETQIHKTRDIVDEEDPEWNDTFQFVAKRDDDLIISVYTTSGDACLGQIEVSLEKADCTGDEMSRKIFATQSGTPFDLKFRFEPRSRLFGLIIGINEYQCDGIPNLKGCKMDAQSMVDLLSQKFHIRSSHFRCLADKKATRSAIIDGFQHHLIENNNIEHGDVMIIYYAGHGSRTTAPNGWDADDNKVETICPHDERTRDGKKGEIFGIPDRTISGLLRKLCKFKGDKITVICDSCHSGGISRAVGKRLAFGASPLPEELDKNIWAWGLPLSAESNIPTGFLDNTMSSHVHLAACRQDELAFEDSSAGSVVRGAFTRDLVKFLKQEDLTKITYSSLLEKLKPSTNQHPQCSGKNRHRALFGGLATCPTLLKLSTVGGKYRTEAGEIHGVVPGTPFTIHAHSDSTSTSSEIGILEADHVSSHFCTLRWRGGKEFDIPSGARALMLNWRPDADVLKVFIEPSQDDVKSIEGVFSLVNHSDSPDLMIHCTPGGTWRFERLDPIISKYARLLDNIPPEPSLPDVLKSISHFNFHLSRGNTEQPLKEQIEVVLHRLKHSNPDEISEEAIYVPDGDTGRRLVVDGENVVFAASEDDWDLFYGLSVTNNSNRDLYGLSVTNNSNRDLFPYLVYFDPSDYSIQSLYHPPAETIAPLPARHKDSGPSELRFGFGEAGVEPFQFTLADGIPTDVGFLRLFVSTTYVDMSVLEQPSPFLVARGGSRTKPPVMDIWDAWTYVLKTVRR